MDKHVFHDGFHSLVDERFETYNLYFDYEYKVFHELTTTVFEIAKCLMLDLHKAAITLTNNFLERILKLALIKYDTGIGAKPVGEWNSIFAKPHNDYTSLTLSRTIEECSKRGLILTEEREYLSDTIRDMIRNGFSHADADKILKTASDEMVGFVTTFSNPKNLQKVVLNPKIIPALQSVQIDAYAKEIAPIYFRSIFNLMVNIEGRLEKTKR